MACRQVDVGYPGRIGIVRLDPSQAKFLLRGILAIHDTNAQGHRTVIVHFPDGCEVQTRVAGNTR